MNHAAAQDGSQRYYKVVRDTERNLGLDRESTSLRVVGGKIRSGAVHRTFSVSRKALHSHAEKTKRA